ncbi:hypothetical protein F3157_06875 [Virgibacillus dakarensis]|uniref:YtxH domain-containing protein n=1 Tax=Lentibacillus populi TaxID=1827502 RepID=A0A9W5TXY7_9BACI|nr:MULTISPECIES: hypothetical protein [Bacillaceae]MBT2216171.1 hypothetical protein [Virgibacillus dakarensis]MTW85383.1 hypothetical protein [Virgibacillus dakarensis]GGB44828.1 hypothetical protein GCM10011409_23010 [Lentibacillus populi]
MKKRYIVSALGAAGIGTAGFLLKDKDKREKLMEKAKSVSGMFKNEGKDSALDDAGIPDQTDNQDLAQFENAKMVSEGSQFGVQYYNEAKEEEQQK